MPKRVKFDFEIDFTNGGGIQGQDFRLDIDGDDISDQELTDYIVKDMRLLMVGQVRILNKEIITEAHKRQPSHASNDPTYIDLSHTIYDGLITYKGLPAAIVCDYLTREESRSRYAPGTEFHIGKIEMVANTGTYVDSPFHRYADGKDLSEMELEHFVDLEGIVIRADWRKGLAVTADAFKGKEIRGRAVLVHTGWAEHWATDAYFENHPFLTEEAAVYLRDCGAKLVGIDSHNIDDTRGNARPVHSVLLRNDIIVAEHLCNLENVPEEGFFFTAAPPKVKGAGTFPVRAFAKMK
ncbi:MAG TPA: cyclase family protein [Anaerolineales bacterium]|nr:cyclase family protein [Anaerolineales bacterium]HNC09740.1 cyclase family protein [Anaerolineales bacterium]